MALQVKLLFCFLLALDISSGNSSKNAHSHSVHTGFASVFFIIWYPSFVDVVIYFDLYATKQVTNFSVLYISQDSAIQQALMLEEKFNNNRMLSDCPPFIIN
jgi:hypothetical protein